MTSSLVYVYAVLAEQDGELSGIDEAPVRYLAESGLVAAVSDVSAEDFDEEPLNERIRDMAWLGPRAVAHQDVNYRLHAATDAIIPLSFGTVFRDDGRVRQMLRTSTEALRTRLTTVRGSAEWVVTLHLLKEPEPDAVAASSAALQALRTEITSSTPGRAHLLRRQLTQLERDEARRLQAEAAEQLFAQLKDLARAVYQEPLPTDAVERPLLRASVLVPIADEPQFVDQIERLRQRWPEPGYRLHLTGPWPPYRFGGLETADD